MPVAVFNNMADGLSPARHRNREHFLANLNLEDGPHWMPMLGRVAAASRLQRHLRRPDRASQGHARRAAGCALPYRAGARLHHSRQLALP